MTKYSNNYHNTSPFSDITPRAALATGIVQTYTVPGDNSKKYIALFSYTENSNVFIGYNKTPTTPAPGTIATDGNQEFRPIKRYVKGGDVLSFLTPDASAYVGVSLLSIPG